MDNSPLDPGLSLTLSWGARDARRRRSLPLGALLRVGFLLVLCAACYEAGRWHGGLEAQLEKPPRTAVASRVAPPIGESLTAEIRTDSSGMAPGQATAEKVDVITPLNVRDPSALVMPPSSMGTAPAAAPSVNDPPSAPQSPPARIFPRPSAEVKPDPRF